MVVDGGSRLTYGEWDRRSDTMAAALAQRGAARGARVLLVFDNARWTDFAVGQVNHGGRLEEGRHWQETPKASARRAAIWADAREWPRSRRSRRRCVLVQRVRLWASTVQHGQATVGEEVPGGHVLDPRASLRSRMASSTSAWWRWEASSAKRHSRSVRNAKGCQCGQSWAWAMSMRRVRRTMRRRPCGRRPSSLDRSLFR